ncbi:maltokinase N-terminal cap-like domain-containing protein [Pseudonocardia endophytica]|uniref:Maltokinase n=1 Tax=Pseudonocardia endophytica TaxID=401976 RepID=A0A4R1HF67_PSEEN|nr:aminoglycoside phosphotransferase [Pseudonocardia endophytica]TCK20774.1 maltokinase [Pseudonocardia endophytica]
MSPTDPLAGLLPGWLPTQRWFAAKGRTIRSVEVAARTPLSDDGPTLEHALVDVHFEDGPSHRYQLLVAASPAPGVPSQAVIESGPEMTIYDGLWDPRVTSWLLEAVRDGRTVGDLRFVPEPHADLPRDVPGRVLGAEQSNTSVVWGDHTIFKLFRRVLPGLNPDLELHRALRAEGSTCVAALQGAVEGTVDGEPASLGMLQDFAAGSEDGWTRALRTVRAAVAGRGDTDFTAEARRLGETVAVVHAELTRALGSVTVEPRELADGWRERLAAAVSQVPELAPLEAGVRAVFDAVGSRATAVPVQRVHGDLHLGQTLRTADRWLVIDFEGEPSAPLAERTRPDSALRDVAGMLRSFDYAAYHEVLSSTAGAGAVEAAADWAARTREAFSDGYAQAAGHDPRTDGALLRAFELDKAVYEAVYETRNRPSWAPIPLASIRRLVALHR